ncbi:MAG: phosphoribosyltransferase family protein, partial [Rikenellaceae bacterium]
LALASSISAILTTILLFISLRKKIGKLGFKNIFITFIKVSSYCGDKSTGQVTHVLGLNIDIKGRDVIIIDDIVDSGVTINELYSIVSGQKPSSIAIAAFIFKPNSYKGGVKIDYIGMTMQDNNFIVGYGLDYNEKGRNFPEIYIAE